MDEQSMQYENTAGTAVRSLSEPEQIDKVRTWGKACILSQRREGNKTNVAEQVDESTIKLFYKNIMGDLGRRRYYLMNLCLYIMAKRLKEKFLKELHERAAKEKKYTRWTVKVNWHNRETLYSFEEEPERCGNFDTITWQEKIYYVNKKTKGKMYNKGFYTQEIKNHNSDEFSYSKLSFKKAEPWELELLVRYDAEFAKIRKAKKMLMEITTKIKNANQALEVIAEESEELMKNVMR